MDLYKCIQCGETRESEESCLCSTCGYKMFKLPYDPQQVMVQEIVGFIKSLEKEGAKLSCSFYRIEPETKERINKAQDDKRFPGFSKIQSYVYSARKTEDFIKRITTSLQELRKYLHTPYAQEYKVDYGKTKQHADEVDAVLTKAVAELGLELKLGAVDVLEPSLLYKENPDALLLSRVELLLLELEKLVAKIWRFIRQNNIYGIANRQKPEGAFAPATEGTPEEKLQACIQNVSQVNKKKYVVDIISDGEEELEEMLNALWKSIFAMMTLPILKQEWLITLGDGTITNKESFFRMETQRLLQRYNPINEAIEGDDALGRYTKEELFKLYTKMIELDTMGLLGVNKNALLKIGKSEEKLNQLVGLSGIKESVKKIKAYAMMNKGSKDLNVHMCFYGNSGTGKTEVARIVAGILYENGILPTDNLVETDRSGLVSEYFGATAEKTSGVIQSAMGGALFIDEAYALIGGDSSRGTADYGKEAIDTLVKAMEDYRGKFCVIFAGYKNETQKMLSVNPGLKSRIQFELEFSNYSREELGIIGDGMLKKKKYTRTESAMSRILDITDVKRKEPNFANAREMRNILDQVIMCQNLRCLNEADREIGIIDVNRYIQDGKIKLPTSDASGKKHVLTGEEELEQLVGLAAVKKMVKKIKVYARRNHGQEDFNLHMCFYGNPGTGKTETARIISRLLYDAGVLPEAKLVETDARGLMGKYVGETASKTMEKIDAAMGGVLFVDEAYQLVPTAPGQNTALNYGAEAVAVLLKEMEDRRGQFCVILAGYKEEMKVMLSSNPGLKSRIQFTLDFPDYSRDEMRDIIGVFLKKKKYEIEDLAMEQLLDIIECSRSKANFANARTARNVLDQVIMNQNLRTEEEGEDSVILLEDVEEYALDMAED